MFLLRFFFFLISFHNILGERKVISGDKARDFQFPYIVTIRLSRPSTLTCSGSIISEKHVLTAAQCFINYNSNAVVTVGTSLFSKGGKHHKLENIIYHAQYNSRRNMNDIGIIRLESTIEFNTATQKINLRKTELPPFSEVILIGWGCIVDQFKMITVDYLTYAEVLTMPQNYCIAYWKKVIDQSKFCVFSLFGQGICSGDAGGPLVYKGSQVGIASHAKTTLNGIFDVYTNVSYFINWIQKAVKHLSGIGVGANFDSDEFVTKRPGDQTAVYQKRKCSN